MTPTHLYLRYISLSLRAQLQYRASVAFSTLGQLITTGTEFLGIWALFARFGSVRGWTLPQLALLYAIISLAFAIAEAIPRGFDRFPTTIKNGDFDRMLLRPRSTILQILGQELQVMRLGRFSQALVILIWSLHTLPIAWTIPKAALLLTAILGGAATFSGLFILSATIAFWTIESLELVNVATYGGVESAQYPITIYPPWLRWGLMTAVPLAAANYFPVHAILARPDPAGSPPWFQWTSPLIGLIFLSISLLIWRLGVKKYQSTGS